MHIETGDDTAASGGAPRKALARARQYVLTRSAEPVYPQWRRVALGSGYVLHHDPRLEIAARDGAALVGSIYDLRRDGMDAGVILDDIRPLVSDEARLFERLSHLAGRWTFFWRSGAALKIVADATGLLPVFYSDDRDAPFAGCNPELVAELAGAPISEAGRARMAEMSYRADAPTELASHDRSPDNWWPGELTPYRGIRHLLPNHVLELPSRRVRRFWPARPIARRPLREAAAEASRLLSAIVAGVSAGRGRVLMPVTAGLDTRTLLAAARPVAARLSCFVYAPAVHRRDDPYVEDRVTARCLAQRLGLPLAELEYPNVLDDDFAAHLVDNMSFITASHTIAFEAQAITHAFGADVTLLNGNVSEIARNFYGFVPDRLVDEDYLTCAMDVDRSPLTRAEMKRWLPSARAACKAGDIELTDLLYWEFRMGCWQAYVQLQLGALFDIFTPYNCRRLLETMLGAPNGARSGMVAPLYRGIIARAWPELLDVPVNPSKARSWRVRAGAFVRRHHLLNFGAKTVWYRCRRLRA
jgi:hypothetical protein